MDTVLLMIFNNELYVYDYYKEKLKAVPFRDGIHFEIYDHFDLREAVEYLNYPLNYNGFKGSKVHYIYNQPMSYQFLWEERELFKKSEGLTTTWFESLLLGYCQEEGMDKEAEVVVMQNYYQINLQNQTTQQKEEPIENAIEITLEKLCTYALKEQETALFDEGKYVVCSPTILERESKGQEKQKKLFLETHCLLMEESLKSDGHVAEGDTLLQYTQHVHRKFFKKPATKHSLKAKQSGFFYFLKEEPEENTNNLWASKHQTLGVISTLEEKKEDLANWLKARGFLNTQSKG